MAKESTLFAGRKKPEGERPRRTVDLSDFENEIVSQAKAAGTILSIDKNLIQPDPDNPRTTFTEASLIELAQSLEDVGLMQPIIVRETGDGTYTICCGERRWRAAMRSSLTELQAIVRNDIDGLKLLQMQVQENEQREGMSPLDLARVYKKAFDALGSDQLAVAEWAGKSKSYISNFLMLADAPAEVKALSEHVSDATSLQLIARLVRNSPEEGRALIESIESGTIGSGGGTIRQAIREKHKAGDGTKKPASAKPKFPQQLKAVKAEWQHTDIARFLYIETEAGEKITIELPTDFE